MGLDQYAFYAKKGIGKADKTALGAEFNKNGKFMYWRKEYSIDNFMRDLYYEKGGEDDFNCDYVRVNEEDLEKLEDKSKNIDFYEGSYYGDAARDMEEEKPNIDKFIELAREYIAEGFDIYYTNWW